MTLVRTVLGDQLRRRRQAQRRTLRDVSGRAQVSLGYLSEIERGQKEPSSELLASICDALEVRVSTLLRDASEHLFVAETSSGEVPCERPMAMIRAVGPVGPVGPVEQLGPPSAPESVDGGVLVAAHRESGAPVAIDIDIDLVIALDTDIDLDTATVEEIAEVAHLPVAVPVERAA